MLYGDQWICSCGHHNITLRTECRNCGGSAEEAIGEESWLVVIDRVYDSGGKDSKLKAE